MAGTGFDYLGRGRVANQVNTDKLKAMVDCPLVSDEISVTATPSGGGAVVAVSVPAGAYVYRVDVLAKSAVASSDFDVGDGDNTDRYFDGITTMTKYDSITSPVDVGVAPGTTGEASGRYYAAADTIDVLVNATATTGTVQVLVWYTVDSRLA